MNKAELIEQVSEELGGKVEATAALEIFLDTIIREVSRGGAVGITGFGTFEGVERAPRTGRNPRTGEAVPIAGTRTPRFRPGTYFKSVVCDPQILPDDRLAGARVSTQVTVGVDGRTIDVKHSGVARHTGAQVSAFTADVR